MNTALFHPAVQKYIIDNLHADVHKIMLGKSPFEGVSARELAEQIDSRRRSEKKLPTWFAKEGIYYPPKLSVEQTSSEITAAYKSGLMKGRNAIDLTGGFGVDSYYLSKTVESLVHVERNKELSEIAEHNLRILGTDNITFVNDDSLPFLKKHTGRFDTIYVDPSRRVENKKVFLLEETEPNVIDNLGLFFSVAGRVVVKTSPMLDIQAGLKAFKGATEELHVVSVKNDCKELLWVLSAGNHREAKIVCSAIGGERTTRFTFTLSDERNEHISTYARPLSFLYEPDVAVLKSGAFKTIAKRFELLKLGANTHLYTSGDLKENFPGKVFKIVFWEAYREFSRKRTSGSFNVVSRNFPLSTDQLKKKHKLSDGGNDFLLFTTSNDQLVTIRAERIS
ncbi:THUMP-like domain-containing protein [Arcticibacter sp.]|uniref:THUMP-like domain-containing protein n=1 Tax=Arcticibacter sp. TaxID=1872630 RepID=UPI003890BBAA